MLLNNKKIRQNLIIFLGFLFLSYFSYFNIINSFFLADDFNWIYQIQTRGAFGVWTTAPDVFFRPVVSLTLFLDYTLWELNPIGYHLTNLSFHAICGFAVYRILYQLLKQLQIQHRFIQVTALIAGLLFIILPSHVEAVTWISARSDLVATAFCLASFSIYLSYKNLSNQSLFIGSYGLFFLALLSKESVIIYPGMIFAYEVYDYFISNQSRHQFKNIFYQPLIYASLFPLYFILRYWGLGQLIGGYGTGTHLQLNSGIILRGLSSSLRIMIPPMADAQASDWQLLFLMTIITFLLLIYIYAKLGHLYQASSQLLLFLATAFLISLLPIINLVVSIEDHQAERFLYFPSVFMVMMVALVMSTILWQYRLILLTGITVLILFFCHSLYTSNKNWQIASTISQQILEDINTQAQTEGLFVTNIPDNFRGAYLYRNGIYPAIQLFCGDKNIKYLPLVLFNNIMNVDDITEITQLSPNQYQLQLIEPKTYFTYPYSPIETRLETENFKITDFDWDDYQSFTVEIKNQSFLGQVFYYSAGHLRRAPEFNFS